MRSARRASFLIGSCAAGTTAFFYTRPEMIRWIGCGRSNAYPDESFSTLEEDVRSNPTVFGSLLRREEPVRVLYEDDAYMAFRNIKPYACQGSKRVRTSQL